MRNVFIDRKIERLDRNLSVDELQSQTLDIPLFWSKKKKQIL